MDPFEALCDRLGIADHDEKVGGRMVYDYFIKRLVPVFELCPTAENPNGYPGFVEDKQAPLASADLGGGSL